jgi:hypothetical protein
MLKGTKLETPLLYAGREQNNIASGSRDRRDLLFQYIHSCRRYYELEIGERLNPQNIHTMHRFARKYAAVKNMLLPDFFELLIAGRSCVGSHFCYRMWEIGTSIHPRKGRPIWKSSNCMLPTCFPLCKKSAWILTHRSGPDLRFPVSSGTKRNTGILKRTT